MLDQRLPLVVLLGPSAVGKTDIAIELALRLNGEIVSADSTLIYQGMDIGTAKPSREERNRVPHHMIDIITPDTPYSLADFQRDAKKVIAQIHLRGQLPLLVGGTGQYIRALIQGWKIPHVQPDSELRKVLEIWLSETGYQGLYNRLQKIDSKAAQDIDPRNARRTIRAFEVIFQTGRKFSDLRIKQKNPYQTFLIGITRTRQELYQRVDDRIELMFQKGLIQEVEGLLKNGYSPKIPAFSAIGYLETIQYVHGIITMDQAIANIKRRTRVFIRHQANWFKPHDPEIRWFSYIDGIEKILENEIQQWLLG
jgi:tRNA dimethylallyltransferase